MNHKKQAFFYEKNHYNSTEDAIHVQVPNAPMISRERLRELSKIQASKSFAYLICDWLVVVCAAYVQLRWLPWYCYPITVVVIATRQHAIGTFIHEGSHFLLFKNRTLNDLVSDWLAAFPLNLSTFGYRRQHFLHHRISGQAGDPDRIRLSASHYQEDQTRRAIFLKLLKCLTGRYIVRELKEVILEYRFSTDLPKSVHISRGLFLLSLLTLAGIFNLWLPLFLFWFVPMSTVLMSILYIRLRAEHDRVPQNKLLNTRNVIPNFLEKHLIGQHNVSYHLDHHLYPSVPFYNLQKLHRELNQNSLYQERALNTQSYFRGLIAEITAQSEETKSNFQPN